MIGRLFGRTAPGGRHGPLDLDPGADPAAAAELLEAMRREPAGSASALLLRHAVTEQGRANVVDALDARPSATRELAAHLCGHLQIEAAAPWLEMRLLDRNRRVRLAAARALGRLGGIVSAEALLRSAGRVRVPHTRLVIELAKASPHLFLEQVVADPDWAAQRPTAIAALGLRKHGSLTLAALLAGVPATGAPELIPLCHVVAKVGDRAAVPWLFGLLDHDDRGVRAAADHALQRVHRTAFGRPLAQPLHLVGAS